MSEETPRKITARVISVGKMIEWMAFLVEVSNDRADYDALREQKWGEDQVVRKTASGRSYEEIIRRGERAYGINFLQSVYQFSPVELSLMSDGEVAEIEALDSNAYKALAAECKAANLDFLSVLSANDLTMKSGAVDQVA